MACQVCAGRGWYFGHGSHDHDFVRFWKMDLEKHPTFDAIWEQARARCEALAGAPLRVVRQYASGHTFGLGGQAHVDKDKPGYFTLLYYPMEEWVPSWEGETVFYGENGEVAESVLPRPNRAVFFDSRIAHAGRGPSRLCAALRVTVAYKLEVVTPASIPAPVTEAPRPVSPFQYDEIERDGARRVYRVRVPSALVLERTAAQLVQLAATVRIPGFRLGKAPAYELERRFGSKVGAQVVDRFAAEAADGLLPQGGLPVGVEASAAAPSADLEFRLTVIHLPDMPAPDCSTWTLGRLRAGAAALRDAGLTPQAADELLSDHFRQQVLDYLDAAYAFPLAPVLVDRELTAIWVAAEAELDAAKADAATKRSAVDELRSIAERRVRLGAVITELARRYEIHPGAGEVKQFCLPAETAGQTVNRLTEGKLIGFLAGQARVSERWLTAQELLQLRDDH